VILFPCQPAVNNVAESGSESDVPLRKKRKLDDSPRASTPLISTPKGIIEKSRLTNACSAKETSV
jgi:hypothetical protein